VVTYDAYDLAGLLFCVLLVLICATVLYVSRPRPNRRMRRRAPLSIRIKPQPQNAIGFRACPPQERL
jgi:hypothetical protein